MIREILFRGKSIVASSPNTPGYWLEGNLFHLTRTPQGEAADSYHILNMNNPFAEPDTSNELWPETVRQFTGLADKNGTKIFEGDIIDATGQWWYALGPAGHDSPIMEVKFDTDTCGFAPFSVYDCDCGVYIVASDCKVIGNIYDNPELLKKEQE